MVRLAGGRDANVLPGITDCSWLKLVSEVGPDMTRWPTEAHFASWLLLSPRIDKSSGRKRRRGKTGGHNAGQVFRMMAQSLSTSKYIALGGFYRRISARRGAKVATVATARKLAVLHYRLMRYGFA